MSNVREKPHRPGSAKDVERRLQVVERLLQDTRVRVARALGVSLSEMDAPTTSSSGSEVSGEV